MDTDDELPPNAILSNIPGALKDPVAYVRSVLANLQAAGADTSVRISVRNGRTSPDYIIDQVMDDETRHVQAISCFNGKTHRPTTFRKFNDDQYWSTARMNSQQVATLLGELRHFKPKKRGLA
jgi:hypothetical protein